MTEPFNLSNKQILITGASSGIGRSIALSCSNQGALLHLLGRNLGRLEETKSKLSSLNHLVYQVDLADDLQISKTTDILPALDGVVFNAGTVKLLPIKYMKRNVIEELFNVNLFSAMLFVQNLVKQNKLRQNASICFISSIASQYVTPGNAIYSASKGAVNSFTKSLALELAPKKIRVNAILPGLIETNILENESAIGQEELELHQKNYPLGRFGKPEDVAYLSVYLLSDASQWMTGSLLKLDGGYSL